MADVEQEEWVPSASRPDDVDGVSAPPGPAKWFVYSKTYQGIAGLVVGSFFVKYFKISLPEAQAQMIADAVVQTAMGLWMTGSVYLAGLGRKQANDNVYFVPKTKAQKIAEATGLDVADLKRVA